LIQENVGGCVVKNAGEPNEEESSPIGSTIGAF